MSKEKGLESIVPPLELCKQIPTGAFADSALVWTKPWTYLNTVGMQPEIAPRPELYLRRNAMLFDEFTVKYAHDEAPHIIPVGELYPAPTLQEILEALGNHGSVFTRRDDEGWMVMLEIAGDDEGYGYDAKIERDLTNPTTAALRLWLEVTKKEKKER